MSKLDRAIDRALTTWERNNPNPTRDETIAMIRQLVAALNGNVRDERMAPRKP